MGSALSTDSAAWSADKSRSKLNSSRLLYLLRSSQNNLVKIFLNSSLIWYCDLILSTSVIHFEWKRYNQYEFVLHYKGSFQGINNCSQTLWLVESPFQLCQYLLKNCLFWTRYSNVTIIFKSQNVQKVQDMKMVETQQKLKQSSYRTTFTALLL